MACPAEHPAEENGGDDGRKSHGARLFSAQDERQYSHCETCRHGDCRDEIGAAGEENPVAAQEYAGNGTGTEWQRIHHRFSPLGHLLLK